MLRVIKRTRGSYFAFRHGKLYSKKVTIILNRYTPNNRASKYKRQKLIGLKGETDVSTFTVGDFNTSPSEMQGFSTQKIRAHGRIQ